MKERPILFKGEMVRAILEERKTQTRRVVKPQPPEDAILTVDDFGRCLLGSAHSFWNYVQCPYGKTGDRLWVKETHLPTASGVYYRADFSVFDAAGHGAMYGGWKPSIFCKRAYSRITLEIVAVSVERLNEITEEDAKAEGVIAAPSSEIASRIVGNVKGCSAAQLEYYALWESINGPGSWALNTWVWVIEFKKL